MTIGLREIELTQAAIRQLIAQGESEQAQAVSAVLHEAVDVARATDQPKPFLTTGQAARALGVSIPTVKNWAKSRGLRMTVLGSRNVIEREELTRFLEAMRHSRPTSTPFDRRGADQARIRAILPTDLVERLDRFQSMIESSVPLTDEQEAEMHVLQKRVDELTTKTMREHLDRQER
jgi:excisionase family DNA binding protein